MGRKAKNCNQVVCKSIDTLFRYSRKGWDVITSVVKRIVDDLEQNERENGCTITKWVNLVPLAMATINEKAHAQVFRVSSKINTGGELEINLKEGNRGLFTGQEENVTEAEEPSDNPMTTDGYMALKNVDTKIQP